MMPRPASCSGRGPHPLLAAALVGVLALATAACARATAQPTPNFTPSPSPTATYTATLIPTATSFPAPTPTPTSVPTLPIPTATATPTAEPPPRTYRQVEVGQEFTLHASETVDVVPPHFTLTFILLLQDSRCPRGAACVTAGEATLLLGVASPTIPPQLSQITIGPEGSASTTVDIYGITVSNLLPYPVGATKIDPKDYQVTVVVKER